MASPSGSKKEESVLSEVLQNDNLLNGGLRPGEADEDYALAKILQEQVRSRGPGAQSPLLLLATVGTCVQ